MPTLRIKPKGQVTLPPDVRKEAGLSTGDTLNAHVEKGRIVLTPEKHLDRRLTEGLEDMRKGRIYGPFASAHDLIASLARNTEKRAKKSKRV